MSVRALSWALRDAPVARHSDLLVLIVVADHAHDDGTGAYPSVPTIAAMARLSVRGVRNALGRLEASGVIAIERRAGRGNAYRVLLTPASGAGVPRQMATGTQANGDTTPAHGDRNPGTPCPRSFKNRNEPKGEPGVPPSKSGGKVIPHPSAGRKPEPYYDRALR